MEYSGFDWDDGNRTKCQKHGLSLEAIEGLFDRSVAILPDDAHSAKERRFRAIGWTDGGRRGVFVVFTLRQRGASLFIRPISARYMHEKEMKAYEEENPEL